MTPMYLSSWHVTTLVNTLSTLLDSSFSVVPLVNSTGVKVFSQWHTSVAQFSFLNADTAVVSLDDKWSEVNRSALITAITHTFHWDYLPRGRTWCCSLLSWRNSRELVFSV